MEEKPTLETLEHREEKEFDVESAAKFFGVEDSLGIIRTSFTLKKGRRTLLVLCLKDDNDTFVSVSSFSGKSINGTPHAVMVNPTLVVYNRYRLPPYMQGGRKDITTGITLLHESGSLTLYADATFLALWGEPTP